MIDEKSLLAYAVFVEPHQVEKDYLQDILLESIYRDSDFLVFKGGTALSKFYSLGRFSSDLDFTAANADVTKDKLDRIIGKAGARLKAEMGYDAEVLPSSMNKFGTYMAEFVIDGPRYIAHHRADTRQHIEIEINTTARLARKANAMQRNPIYMDVHAYIALLMDLEEVLSEKVRALLSPRRRHRERDLYDIHFLLGKNVPLNSSLISLKLREAEMPADIMKALPDYIAAAGKTWKQLEPLVWQRTLQDFPGVEKQVMDAFKRLSGDSTVR